MIGSLFYMKNKGGIFMKEDGSIIAREIVEENRKEKAIQKLLKCKKCIFFDKSIYQCKEKECIDKKKLK